MRSVLDDTVSRGHGQKRKMKVELGKKRSVKGKKKRSVKASKATTSTSNPITTDMPVPSAMWVDSVFDDTVSREHGQKRKMKVELGKKRSVKGKKKRSVKAAKATVATWTSNPIPTDMPVPSAINTTIHELRLLLTSILPWEGALEQCIWLESRLEILNSSLKEIIKETKEAHQESSDDDAAASGSRGLVQGKELIPRFKTEVCSLNGKEDTKGRYLCISNGFEIWCLDLKQSMETRGHAPLPKITSLSLVGGELPASVGLFKLGSDVYMIGGQDIPTSLKEPLDSYCRMQWGKFPSPFGLNAYKILSYSWGIKGSSCVSYRLSLADDGTLTASKAHEIKELNKPKVWPIVEQINGQLHVVDSVPFYLKGCRDSNFSHEVCNLDGSSSWENIPTIEEMQYTRVGDSDSEEEDIEKVHIWSHVVVGDRIYAVAYEGGRISYIEFDSLTRIWKRSPILPEWLSAFKMKRVWDIIAIGTGRCVGEFPCGGGEKVFVLVAVVKDYKYPGFDSIIGTQAVAYLVTMTGQVICYQPLPGFFMEGPFHPCDVGACTLIHVDELEDTMCSLVSGTLLKDGQKRDYVFVNTFSVEMRTCVADKVRQLLVEKASEAEVSPAVKLHFVRVALKDTFIYETNTDLRIGGGGHCGQFVNWRACFLTL